MKIQTISRCAERFFIFTCLGIDIDDFTKETAISACVRRAYLDMCRTLRVKESWKNKKEKIIKEMAEIFISQTNLEEARNKVYELFFEADDSLKDSIKEHLKDKSGNGVYFSYGHAQKWINMTLKYMWLLDLIPDNPNLLEAPIDRHIIRAINSDELNDIKWSEISKKQYLVLQNAIPNNGTIKIEWESNAWIEQLKKARN